MINPRIEPSEYGDESEVFVKASDGMEMLGGSYGTAIEFFHAMKINERKIKNREIPVYIAPIYGIPGFSSTIYQNNIKESLSKVIPPVRTYSGKEAADFLISNLFGR